MVNSTNSTVVSRKRKKSKDMSESPPKRVTRARAKANEDSELNIKTTKITTASARAAAASRTPAKPAKTTKRKTRADDTSVDTAQEKEASYKPESEPPKSRGRPRKITDGELEQSQSTGDAPPRTRSRLEKPLVDASENAALVPKPKGRPRKVVASASAKNAKTIPLPRLIPGLITAKSKTLTKASILKPPVNRKTVTFKDSMEIDKENDSVPAKLMKAKQLPEPKATGLKAKPVRKPTISKANTRGTRSAQSARLAADTGMNDKAPLPLSPKKVTQMAKSSSVCSEDELCGEKTPTKVLSRSPVKPPTTANKGEPMRMSKSASTSMAGAMSPTRGTLIDGKEIGSIFASPARRPPQSPFKDALKDSPKKFNISSSVVQPALSASQSALKTSSLNSPARRPTSPTKIAAPGSPAKSSVVVPFSNAAMVSKQYNPFEMPTSTPSKFADGQSQAARSTQRTLRFYAVDSSKLGIHTDESIEESELEHHDKIKANCATSKKSDPVAELSIIAERSSPSAMLQSPPASPMDVDGVQAEASAIELTTELVKERVDLTGSARATEPSSTVDMTKSAAFSLTSSVSRYTPEDSDSEDSAAKESDSEDELNATASSAPRSLDQTFDSMTKEIGTLGTPTPSRASRTPKGILKHNSRQANTESLANFVSMTPLATQMSGWLASSPERKASDQCRSKSRGIFSFVVPTLENRPSQPAMLVPSTSPLKSTFFEDEMAIHDQEKAAREEDDKGEDEESLDRYLRQGSEDSDQYSDENVVPIDPQLLATSSQLQISPTTCTPARVFHSNLREVCTVSKVPLRPAAEDSPIKISRKRSRSLSGPMAVTSQSHRTSTGNGRHFTLQDTKDADMIELPGQGQRSPLRVRIAKNTAIDAPSTPTPNSLTDLGTPLRTVRKGSDAEILRGAVVYVDVHTTEGTDASEIFIELLTLMGARCVKQWTWSPPASLSGSLEGANSSQGVPFGESTPNGRVGITHVVYKDGGKRTLEKVRESKSLVVCVGVGWVLDCERENKWLDEIEYAIDTSLIPRGGHRRRKSMEPRSLSNINGSLVPTRTPAKLSVDLSPTKEFLNLSSPPSRRDSFGFPSNHPETPRVREQFYQDGDSSWGSPGTPYYLSRGAELVQQTCPPNQTHLSLFPISGRIEDQPDERVRRRLLLARRKSLQWAPKVGSPLGRAVSHGE